MRRRSGISQRALAEGTNLDFSYISKLENDRIPPPAADTIVNMCDFIGESPEELLTLTGKIPSDVRQKIGGSQAAQEFLREAHRSELTDEEWKLLSDEIKRMRGAS